MYCDRMSMREARSQESTDMQGNVRRQDSPIVIWLRLQSRGVGGRDLEEGM